MTSSLSRSNSSSSLASAFSSSGRRSAMAKASLIPVNASTTKTFGHKLFSILLGGEKGSGLPGYVDLMAGRGTGGTNTPRKLKTKGRNGSGQQENPVARLKLLLVCFYFSFLTMDILLILGSSIDRIVFDITYLKPHNSSYSLSPHLFYLCFQSRLERSSQYSESGHYGSWFTFCVERFSGSLRCRP